MTAKKEVKKPVKKTLPKEQPLEEPVVLKQEPYTPVFESIKIRSFKRLDLNWLSLGIRFNKAIKFMRSKPKPKPLAVEEDLRTEFNKKPFKEIVHELKPDFCKFWSKFCVIWNYYINNDKSRDINERLQEIEDYAERNKKYR